MKSRKRFATEDDIPPSQTVSFRLKCWQKYDTDSNQHNDALPQPPESLLPGSNLTWKECIAVNRARAKVTKDNFHKCVGESALPVTAHAAICKQQSTSSSTWTTLLRSRSKRSKPHSRSMGKVLMRQVMRTICFRGFFLLNYMQLLSGTKTL